MGKKKFIDKKKSATFQLLARDSSDPNYGESDRVFVRVDNNRFSVDRFFAEDDRNDVSAANHNDDGPNSIFADAPDDTNDDEEGGNSYFGNSMRPEWGFDRVSGGQEVAPLPEHARKEILELGFPDDGYNYLTHLREIKNTGSGSAFYHNPKFRLEQLPGDVKAYDASRVPVPEVKSDEANDKSIYSVASKTAVVKVQRVVDPDVAAFLDGSDLSQFGSDVDELEEDFVVRANYPDDGEDVSYRKNLNLVGKSELMDEATNGHDQVDGEVEEVGNRPVEEKDDLDCEKPQVRRLLDEQFELLERQEYGTDDEDDEYDGYVAEEDEYLADKLKHTLDDRTMDDLDGKYEVPADLLHGNERPKSKELLDSAVDIIRRCAEYAEKYENEDENEDVIVQESSSESQEWDCETIVSTYSNLDNHPARIGAPESARKKKLAERVSGALNATSNVISLRGKEKIPLDFLPRGRKSETEKMKGVPDMKVEQQKRKQYGQESKEEKKERKAAVKEERREARRLKKEMKGLYRNEAQRAQKVAAVAGPSSIHLM